MIETISAAYLIALGILLIGLEAITFSFILFFFGVGFVIVGGVSYLYTFENALVQVAVAFVIALILAFLFRSQLLKKLSKPSEDVESRTHISGIGYIEDGAIKFDGTYWKTLSDLSSYNEGDRVQVIDVVDNMVVIKESE